MVAPELKDTIRLSRILENVLFVSPVFADAPASQVATALLIVAASVGVQTGCLPSENRKHMRAIFEAALSFAEKQYEAIK